jgi:4'-phosphopantetheinyl transferase
MTQVEIELRLIHLRDVPAAALRAQCRQESERAARFRFARHRDRFLAGRTLLRHMLADWSGLPAARLRFGQSGNGKPILLDRPALHFNLSYADQAILIGVSEQAQLGVDIEQRRAFPEARALAEDIFDRQEQAALRRGSALPESDLFLCGWTRKEACLKASAHGLALDPASISTGLETGARHVRIGRTAVCRVETSMDDHHIISWATMI